MVDVLAGDERTIAYTREPLNILRTANIQRLPLVNCYYKSKRVSRTGIEPNCPTTMHFRIFRRAFTCKIYILLRKITPKSIKNAFAGGCEQF